MDPALATSSQASFLDGLGERRRATDASGAEPIERLCLAGDLTKIPSFEFALRERASRLAGFRHPCFARVRSIDRLNDAASTLAVVSDAVRGVRLATLLSSADGPTIDINAALHLIRQLVNAVAVLHEQAPDVGHGAIAPERIIVTPNARVVVTEYVLGAALEQLRYPRDRYWSELRVAVPPSETLTRLDHRADVTQIGVTALALILGRTLDDLEYPTLVGDILASATAKSSRGDEELLPSGLRGWLARALQLDPRGTFDTAIEARDELERVLADDEDQVPQVRHMRQAAAEPPKVLAELPKVLAEPPRVLAESPNVLADSPRVLAEPLRTVVSSELTDQEPAVAVAIEQRSWGPRLASAAAAIVVLAGGGYGATKFFAPHAAAIATGTVSVTTVPPGAQVLVDGQSHGLTPLTLALAPGSHTLELRGAGEPRTIPISVNAGQQLAQYVELGKSAPTAGKLQVRSEPAGAQVIVDGADRGRAPLLIDALAPGEHTIVLQSDAATVKQTVTIEAGQTASLVVPLTAAEGVPVSGWVAVKAPVELQLFENKNLLGTTQSDRIMVSAGKHDLELVNEPLGYRVTRTVQVAPGKVASIAVNWPTGTLAINALPWADVTVDGNAAGQTPIGNLTLSIGPHEIVFRHPDFGEQRQAVTVSLKAPARVSVDMRKKP
jgi:hypothetical protein